MPGKTLLPGLIDMHVHLDSPADIGGYRGLEFTDSFLAMAAVGNARAMLDAGFTTVRNVGSGNRNDVGLKQAIDDGYAVGPRIVPAGYALGATGGHCDSTYPAARASRSRRKKRASATAPEELRYQVRRQRKFGAEVIKVCATGGVFSRNTEPGQQQLTEDELRAIADEAHSGACGSPPTPMAPTGIKAAIRAGIDTIEHASLVDDEGIRLAMARKRPVWFSMDIYNTEYTQAEGKKNGVLEDESPQGPRDRARSSATISARRTGPACGWSSARDAGVMPHGQVGAAVPDDGRIRDDAAGGDPGGDAQRRRGARPQRTSGRSRSAATATSSRCNGDPLRDVAVLENVDAVIKGGEAGQSAGSAAGAMSGHRTIARC